MKHIINLYNKPTRLALIIVMSLYSVCLLAQTDLENHKKYWYYKTRLNNDFIKIGNSLPPNDHGESMPLNERGWEDNSGTYTYTSSEMKIGDGSARLGIYIAVLATEYKLLLNNGQDVTKVKHELFCALNAVNRLDYYAEKVFSNNTMSPSLNGFFMRDDVPADLVSSNYQHFNYYNHGLTAGMPNSQNTDKGFTQTFDMGQRSLKSTYSGYLQDVANGASRNDQLESREESQDQAYYLLVGLALTSKLVNAGETDGGKAFGYGSGETELKKEAINISDRIIKHMKGSSAALGAWDIRNPANGNAFVKVGHDAKAYAYPLDNSGCFIKYNQDMPFIYFPLPGLANPLNPCNDYRNIFSATAGPAIWKTLAQIDGGYTVDMQGFFHATAAICNCIFEDTRFVNLNVQQSINNVLNQINNLNNQIQNQIQNFLSKLPKWVSRSANWVINTINQLNTILITGINALNAIYSNLLAQLMPSFKTNTTDQRLVHNTYLNNVAYAPPVAGAPTSASHLGSDAYFGIYLREVLHPNTGIIQLPNWLQFAVPNPQPGHLVARNDMRNILDAAPCQGNYRKFPDVPSPYWGASNRLDRQDPLWRPSWGDGNQGEYNGTDYMLLHNLYYLTEGTSNGIIDYSERKVIQDMPYSSGLFSSSNKATLGAYEYITASNTINANGAAEYRAGKEITLLPNFSTVPGADFSAYIAPYNCSASGSPLNKMASSNSNDFTAEPAMNISVKEKKQVLPGAKQGANMELDRFNSQITSLIKKINAEAELKIKTSLLANLPTVLLQKH